MIKTYYIQVTLTDGKDVTIIYNSEFKKGTTQHYVDFLRRLSANDIHLASNMNRDNLMNGVHIFKREPEDESVIKI